MAAPDATRLRDQDLHTVCLMLAMQVGFPTETAAFLQRVADAPEGEAVASSLETLPWGVRKQMPLISGSEDVEVWRFWTPRIARFSFRSRPLMAD